MPGSTQIRDRTVGADNQTPGRTEIDPGRPPHPRGRPRFFGVAADAQSYRNIVYLLIALPLGTFYFSFLVTGISLGFGLIPLALVGLPLLVGVVVASRAFVAFERTVARALLGVDVPPIAPVPAASGWKAKLTAIRRDRVTWSGLGYLFLKFPVGVATFTAAVTLLSTSVGFAFAPAYMWASDDLAIGDWNFDPYPWSFALVPAGFILFFVSLHVLNWAASLCGIWCRSWLTGPEIDLTQASQPHAPAARPDARDWQTTPGPRARRVLEVHAFTFAAGMAVLLIIDIATGGPWWFHWVLIAWGGLLALHTAVVLEPAGMRRSLARHLWHLHAVVFGAVVSMLFLFDLASGGGWWFYWLFIWGAVVALHAALVFRLTDNPRTGKEPADTWT